MVKNLPKLAGSEFHDSSNFGIESWNSEPDTVCYIRCGHGVWQESHEHLSTCCFVTSLRHFIHLVAYSANLTS